MRTAIEGALTAMPASIPSPSWSGFDIGPITIHAYALCILVGIIGATILTNIRWNRRHAPEGSIWDIAIWAIPFGIIGGRLYHVFSSPDNYFGPHYDGTGNLWLIPQIWLGGLGIWGAVVLGVIGAWIGCRRSGVKLTSFVDAAAPGLLLAQGLGRWGNYFNQELFGAPTKLPWGLQIDPGNANFPSGYPVDTLFHPTFLYESIWDLLGVAVLLLLDRRFHFRRGRLFWLYAMYYTLGRVWIELLRIDDAEHITFFGITTRLNVWTSILVFTAALVAFLLLTFVRRGYGRDSVLLKDPVDAPAAAYDGNDADDDGADGDGDRDGADDDGEDAADVRDADSRDQNVPAGGLRGNVADNQNGGRHVAGTGTGAAGESKD
ncbi:prolipoprotein diacylglyceryl transferase [Paenarthrobacter sp. Z7-10]|uniref:prolipoprotein diacylglyceryl transferase n=1 Tax=Paenarthrobacter sp. Z7-10 TaxID=2787635 RepID=UPI0022A98FA5|nr:prolipoprotein diacylglyceryl transferase [Paenarthrobacter sp. Z7-10]MCZ2403418.1 prolipoprotein diacylglyceryl transferase [Paenarthrobacter sp. Z7-10]